jgi:hypothetical protein
VLFFYQYYQPIAQEWLTTKKQPRAGISSAADFQFFIDKKLKQKNECLLNKPSLISRLYSVLIVFQKQIF